MELSAGCLAQHSMYTPCTWSAQNHVALRVCRQHGRARCRQRWLHEATRRGQGGQLVTTGREPCTSRSFAAASSAGGSGDTARLEAAWGTLELRRHGTFSVRVHAYNG